MSIDVRPSGARSMEFRRRLMTAAFLTLLLLGVVWPSPIVATNRLCCDAPLGIDELSFLGREAPAWDVAYWFLTGLLLLIILQSSEWSWADIRVVAQLVRSIRPRVDIRVVIAALIGAALTAAAWRFADAPVTAFAEVIKSETVEDVIRLVNRFGGGMNPAMIALYFLVAGVVFRRRRWVAYAITMAIAGLAAGLLAQAIKVVVGRSRPELWLGPFHHAHTSASSFPSGHTVGAFALAGTLLFLSPSWWARWLAIALAAAVAVSRILAFRHWLSDVLASTVIGLLAAFVVARGVSSVTVEPDQPT
ncbi:MAG TPA: phosphatase PAP2 family protein [Thermoanaerobaculia bacterium]|nr:phosphatase PAP2 family protein [Thermoanaerobaculia bacterium]